MGNVRIEVADFAQLQRELVRIGHRIDNEIEQAMREAARYGATEVVREGNRRRPKPYASGAYQSGWKVIPIRGGAALANATPHAIFVERGRLPGKMPPVDDLVEWVYLKRLASRKKASRMGKRTLKPTKGALREKARARAIAFAVARKIAKKGTKGRHVLRGSMPKIGNRAKIEVRKAVRAVTRTPRKR